MKYVKKLIGFHSLILTGDNNLRLGLALLAVSLYNNWWVSNAVHSQLHLRKSHRNWVVSSLELLIRSSQALSCPLPHRHWPWHQLALCLWFHLLCWYYMLLVLWFYCWLGGLYFSRIFITGIGVEDFIGMFRWHQELYSLRFDSEFLAVKAIFLLEEVIEMFGRFY